MDIAAVPASNLEWLLTTHRSHSLQDVSIIPELVISAIAVARSELILSARN